MMLGAVVGDIAGSTYEARNCKIYQDVEIFARNSRATDDTVLTLATADALVKRLELPDGDSSNQDVSKFYVKAYQAWGNKYPKAGYGKTFQRWLSEVDPKPYNSWGNGSAMRVSPIAWIPDKDLDWVLEEARISALVTHNHEEGIKGAQATAAAIFLARKGHGKDKIQQFVTETFGYDLKRTIAEIRPFYTFDVSCQGSVPEAIIAFLESKDFEDCIRLAISIGGDSDTIAAISGSIAHAYYGIPDKLGKCCRGILDTEQCRVLDEFCQSCAMESEDDTGKDFRGCCPRC